MHVIVGTIPDQDFPLVTGQVNLKDNAISIQGQHIPVSRGTPALLAAAIKTGEFLAQPAPYGYLVGDIGLGVGSRRLCDYLAEHLGEWDFQTITFHYLQPNVRWHKRVLSAVEQMAQQPILVADAGSMYAAKMSGKAQAYDLFTPDIGELAFLADEQAPHPLYTRGLILHEEKRVPGLITRSYVHNNAARNLLVKGERDYVANQIGIEATIDYPMVEAMEAIGGTGDTLTGIVAALIATGMEISEAAIIAARANRLAGYYVNPTAATQVGEIVSCIPGALEEILTENKKGETEKVA
jgi:hypothetical protein